MNVRFLSLIATIVLLAGCTSSPKIFSDFDAGANFGEYKTFGFFDELGTDRPQYSSLITSYIKEGIVRELSARGYRLDESNPDVEINFFLRSEEKTQVTQVPRATMGYYDPWFGHYGYWGGYGYDTRVSQYTEGTLSVHMVDMKREQIVWEGAAVGRITDKALQAPREPINDTLTLIFAEYPFTAF